MAGTTKAAPSSAAASAPPAPVPFSFVRLVRTIVWEAFGMVQFLLFVGGLFVYAPALARVTDWLLPRLTGPIRATRDPAFFDYIDKAIPFFVVSIVTELVVSRWKERAKRARGEVRGNGANPHSLYPTYRLNDTLNSMSLGLLQQMFNSLQFAKPLLYGPYIYVWEHYALYRMDAASPLTWVVCFLAVEFGYYLYHRMGHELNWAWAAHIAHHSSQEYNLSTALRQGMVQYAFSWMYYVPGALLVPPPVFNALSAFNRIYQFWIHTEYIGKLPRLVEYVFVTPSHHRVHHAANPQYIDKNYGGTLIVYDRAFGTFAEEHPDQPCVYGLTRNLNSWSPLWANAHHWAHMYAVAKRAVATAAPWHAVRVLCNGPGWSPTGGAYKLPAKKVSEQRHDTSVYSTAAAVYVVVMYASCIGALKVLALYGAQMAYAESALCVGYMVSTTVAIGGFLDRRAWAYRFDLYRLCVTVLVALAVLYHRTAPPGASTASWLPDQLWTNRSVQAVLGVGGVLIVAQQFVAALEVDGFVRAEAKKRIDANANAKAASDAAPATAPEANAFAKPKDL